MKKLLTIFCLIFTISAFSQEKKVNKGYITFNSNATMPFKNLVITGDKVTYFNEVSKSEMSFSLNAVKKIVDGNGTIQFESVRKNAVKSQAEIIAGETRAEVVKTPQQQLVYKSNSRILLDGKKLTRQEMEQLLKPYPLLHKEYRSGKNHVVTGNLLIGGGIGLFIGGGLNNLSNADNGKSGSPALLIAGIVTSLVGIPVRVGGIKKIKGAVESYNAQPAQVSSLNKADFKVIAGVSGVGVQVKF